MSKDLQFTTNDELFGSFAYVKTNFSEDIHQYKIIGRIKSNYYSEVPILYNTKPQFHDNMEDVILVLHCGIAEDQEKIHRVAMKDCERIGYRVFIDNTELHEEGEKMSEELKKCPFCGSEVELMNIDPNDTYYMIECQNENCNASICFGDVTNDKIKTMWNKRVTDRNESIKSNQ